MGWKKAYPYLVGYFTVWFGCGVAYDQIADWSHGDDFVFAGDVKPNSIISAFKAKTGSTVNDGIIRAVIDGNPYGRSCTHLEIDPFDGPLAPRTYLVCNKPLGVVLSHYYYERLRDRGYTSYETINLEHRSVPDEIRNRAGGFRILHWYRGRDTERVFQDTAAADDKELADCCYVVELALHGAEEDKLKLLLIHELKATQGTISADSPSIRGVLFNSLTSPDEDLFDLQLLMDGSYYSLVDFLYFSAITITTVGFGDIVPHSQIVRVMVMLETVVGIVLIGIFGTKLLTP
jgi:hypothetical protein